MLLYALVLHKSHRLQHGLCSVSWWHFMALYEVVGATLVLCTFILIHACSHSSQRQRELQWLDLHVASCFDGDGLLCWAPWNLPRQAGLFIAAVSMTCASAKHGRAASFRLNTKAPNNIHISRVLMLLWSLTRFNGYQCLLCNFEFVTDSMLAATQMRPY